MGKRESASSARSGRWSTFRQRVGEQIRREIAEEDRAASALREQTVPLVRNAVEEARKAGLCTRAWLFGSFAWGKPGERSDVDLLVEGATDPLGIASLVGQRCGRDVHVVRIEDAPETLRTRAIADAVPI